jgi:DNA-binding XRE family transcriptional regulator
MGSALRPDGAKIKNLRIQKGWPQEQLARIADVSPRTVQRIEAGGNSSFETLRCLANAFEMEANELLRQPVAPARPEAIAPPAKVVKTDMGFAARCWPFLPFLKGMAGAAALVLLATFGIRLSPFFLYDDPGLTMNGTPNYSAGLPSDDPGPGISDPLASKVREDASALDRKQLQRETGVFRESPRMRPEPARASLARSGNPETPDSMMPLLSMADPEPPSTRLTVSGTSYGLSISAASLPNRFDQLLQPTAGVPWSQADSLPSDPGFSQRVGREVADGYDRLNRSFQRSGKNTAALFARIGSSLKKSL